MDFKTLGQIEFPGSTVEQEYPPGPMSGYETLIPGHGVFCASATAESNDGTYNSYEAFDGDLRDISAWQPKYPTGGDFGTNGIATTQTRFDPGGGAALVNGPALIIQFPHKVRITSYNVYARKASDVSYLYANKPKSGRVYGSNDGSTWTHVDTFGDWTTWVANTPQTEVITTPGAYNRYAMVVESMIYQSQTWVAIGEWKLYGHRENDLVRLPDPTNVLKYPHIIVNEPAKRGYVVSQSSELVPPNSTGSYQAYNIFDGELGVDNGVSNTPPNGTFWITGASKYDGSGNPTGTASTTNVTGQSPLATPGEYFQLELPHKVKLSSIRVLGNQENTNNLASRSPVNAVLAGSNDGTTWTTVLTYTGASWTTLGEFKNFPANVDSTNAYKYFRFIITKNGGNNHASITEFQFYGTGVDSIPIQIGGGNIDKVANFRVYDKFIGEDQVNEIWNAQKEEFGRAKPQMVLQQGKLGIGTDAPQGSLSVADEPDPTTYGFQEFPPKPLAGYKTFFEGHGEFCVSVSSFHSDTYAGWKAFDKCYTSTGGEGVSTWISGYDPIAYNSSGVATRKFWCINGSWRVLDIRVTL